MRRCAGRRMRADEGEGGGNVTLLRRGWIFADVCGGSGPVGPRTGAARKRSRRRRRRSRARGGAVRIELGHRRALPLCGQSCVAGACAPGRRRLCVPGSASECCAGAKLRSGPWRGGGGKDLGCRANILHNQCNKGQTVFNLHITAICTRNGEQNCFRCATQRRCIFCTHLFCMRRESRFPLQWRRNEGRKARETRTTKDLPIARVPRPRRGRRSRTARDVHDDRRKTIGVYTSDAHVPAKISA